VQVFDQWLMTLDNHGTGCHIPSLRSQSVVGERSEHNTRGDQKVLGLT